MKKTFLLFLMPVLFVLNIYSQTDEENYIRFILKSRDDLHTITRIISIDNVVGDTVYAYATGSQLEDFRNKTDYSFKLTEPYDLSSKSVDMATSVSDMANWDKYPTYGVYMEMMQNYAANYPEICKLDTIGTTVEGRNLLVLKITDNPDTEEDEPEFFYTSTMHGDETTGYVLMLRMIDSLLTTYDTSQEIKSLVDEIEIYINPNANPDGTYGGGDETLSGAHRGNANNVDLNRNFHDPIDGEHPDGNAWQPETKAMMNFAEERNIVLSANFHGGTEVANYPWDGTSRAHPDEEWLQHISLVYANSAIEHSPSGYFKSITSSGIINGYDWYSIYGGRQDYMTYFQHGREVTMEISDTKLLSSDLLPDYWEYNREALFLYMRECLYGIRGIVTDTLGNPLEARVTVLNHDTEKDSSMVFTDPDVGNYHRMIATGTYDLEFYSPGFNKDTVYNVQVEEGQTTRVDVELKQVPVLKAEPTSFSEYLLIDSSETKLLKIENVGVGILNYSVDIRYETGDGWISVSRQSGSISRETVDSIYVTLDAAELDVGVYNAAIDLNYDNGKSETLPVELIVNSSEVFSVEPDTLHFSLVRFNTDSLKFTLSNISVNDAGYNLSLEDSSYAENLLIQNASGLLEKQTSTDISVQIDPEELPLGTSQIDIILTDDSDFLMKIPVFVEVIYEPVLAISVDSFALSLEQNKKDSALFSLINQSKDTIYYQVQTDLSELPWLTIRNPEDSILPGDSTELKCIFSALDIDTGDYPADIAVSQSYDDSVLMFKIHFEVTPNTTQVIQYTEWTDVVKLYPNPFKDKVHLVLELKKPLKRLTIDAYNTSGQLFNQFSFHNLPPGRNVLRLDFNRKNSGTSEVVYLKIGPGYGIIGKKLIHQP